MPETKKDWSKCEKSNLDGSRRESLLIKWASIRAKRLTEPDTDIDNYIWTATETFDKFSVELVGTKIWWEAPSRKGRPWLCLSRQAGSAWLRRQLRSMRVSKGHLGESHPWWEEGSSWTHHQPPVGFLARQAQRGGSGEGGGDWQGWGWEVHSGWQVEAGAGAAVAGRIEHTHPASHNLTPSHKIGRIKKMQTPLSIHLSWGSALTSCEWMGESSTWGERRRSDSFKAGDSFRDRHSLSSSLPVSW